MSQTLESLGRGVGQQLIPATVTGSSYTSIQVRADGQVHDRVANPSGQEYPVGASVMLARVGDGLQVVNLGGQWAP